MKVSKTGYKKNSKDKNEPALVIPSNQITMKGVGFPVFGVSDTGDAKMMYPGLDYSFGGNYVYELPMAEEGYAVPGRYRNPEGNWVSVYTNGGDISIPDLSRPNWLDKAQKGQQVKYYDDPLQFKKANRAYEDSLSLYNQYPAPSRMASHRSVPWQEIQNEFIRNRDPGYINYFGAVLNDKLALDQKSKTKIAPVGIAPLTADTETSDTSYNYVYKKPTQQPVYKEKPKEYIPTKTVKLEREPVELVMPQSDRTLMPYNNTMQVLRSVQQDDRDKEGPKVVPAPDFKHGGWLDRYQEGKQVNQPVNATWSNEFGTYMLPEATVKPSISPAATQAILNREANMAIAPAPSAFDRRVAQAQYMMANPFDAFGNYVREGYVPQGNLGNYGMREKSSPIGQLLMDFNPYNWANAAYRASIRGGDPDTYTTLSGAGNMGADLLEALPVTAAFNPLYKEAASVAKTVGKNVKNLPKTTKNELMAQYMSRALDKTNLPAYSERQVLTPRIDPINRSSVNVKNDLFQEYGDEGYKQLIEDLYNHYRGAYEMPLVEFKSSKPSSFFTNVGSGEDAVQGKLFKEKFCLPGSECAKTSNAITNKTFTEITGLPFAAQENAHNAWHLEDQMTRHGAKNVTEELAQGQTPKVGDRVLMGNDIDQSTFVPGYTADPEVRHAGFVAGYHPNSQGNLVPMILESGKNSPVFLNPISNTFTGPNSVKQVIRPRQFLDDTFGKGLVDKNIRYAYRDKPSVAEYSSQNETVQSLLNEAQQHREPIKRMHDLTNDEFDELLNSLIGIGAQETKLNATLPSGSLPAAKIKLQNTLADMGLTGPVKQTINLAKKTANTLTSKSSSLPKYPGTSFIEMESAKLADAEGIPFSQALRTIKSQYQPKPKFTPSTVEPSKGMFRQKFKTENARTSDFEHHITNDELGHGLSQMAENFSKIKKLYPDATPRQLIDLTTLMWNSPGKAQNKQLVDFYLLGKGNPNPAKFKFDYLNKVNKYRDALINVHPQSLDPYREIFRAGYPEIQYKKGGWLDSYQEGNQVDIQKDPQIITQQNQKYQDAIKWHEDWMNSPMYKQMLYEGTDYSKFPSVNNLAAGDFDFDSDDWGRVHNYDPNLIDAQRRKSLSDLKKTPLYISNWEASGAGGMYDPRTKDISVYPIGYNEPGLMEHEVRHAMDTQHYLMPNNPGEPMYSSYKGIPKKDTDYLKAIRDRKFEDSPMFGKITNEDEMDDWYGNRSYIQTPTEVNARLAEIRKQAQEQKVYDPFTQPIPNDFFKNFDSRALKELKNYYKEEEIQHMLNNFSYNNNQNNPTGIYQSKLGGSTKWLEKYQKKGEVTPPANLPWINQQGQFTQVPPTEPKSFERSIDEFLGNPMQKSQDLAGWAAGSDNDPVDNLRHPAAAMYATEALGSSLGAGMAANALGAAHEISVLPATIKSDGWYHGLRSTAEDLFNNAVGAGVGMIPFLPTEAKESFLLHLSDNDMLPDGVSMAKGDMYWKKKDGGQSQGDGYYDYIKGKGSNAYSIFAKGGSKGWLDNYK